MFRCFEVSRTFLFISAFVNTFKTGIDVKESNSSIYFSSDQDSLVGSTKYTIKLASFIELIACLLISSLKTFSSLWIHGVSKNIICESSSLKIPKTLFLVVCGTDEIIETFSQIKALTKVDFPTFGLPITAIYQTFFLMSEKLIFDNISSLFNSIIINRIKFILKISSNNIFSFDKK
jgi:hypothetical protein